MGVIKASKPDRPPDPEILRRAYVAKKARDENPKNKYTYFTGNYTNEPAGPGTGVDAVDKHFRPNIGNPYEPNDSTEFAAIDAVFWVGVNGHASDPRSRPAPRMINSFTAVPVALTEQGPIFNYNGWYRIPECEYCHINVRTGGPQMKRYCGPYRIESKEDKMTKTTKTIEQPVIANFETEEIVVNTEPKPKPAKINYRAMKDAARAFRAEHIDEIKEEKPVKGVTSALPGKDINNLTNYEPEQILLGKAAAYFNWGTEFCTVAQAKKFGGTLDPEYDGAGWLALWKPTTPKTGKNAGVTSQWDAVLYPKDAFVWVNGEPEFDTELEAARAERKAKANARKLMREAKEAAKAAGIEQKAKRTTKRTNAPKAKAPNFDAEYKALKAELDEQKAANAALAAQIAEMNNATAQTTAILAALAGKLGI